MNQPNIRVIFGMKLKQLRQQRELSLEQLSKLVELSPSYLNEIEKGKKYPKVEKVVRIAEALNVSYDDLVSQRLDEAHHYLETLLASPGVSKFPFHLFGITIQDLLSLVPNAPKEGQALVKALVDTARGYGMRIENFFHTALRCYQEMRGNYFPEIEEAVDRFREEQGWAVEQHITAEMLYDVLRNDYNYIIDEAALSETQYLNQLRSVWINKTPAKLLVNSKFSPIQKAFIAGRELGYLLLGIENRGHCSPDIEVQSFEQVLNAFKASYFSSALFMNRDLMQEDLKKFLGKQQWDETAFLKLIDKYHVTSEMFFYRLSEILPRFFNIKGVHFLRFNKEVGSDNYLLTKQLNMSQVSIPTGLDLNEHFCNRWLSIRSIRALEQQDNVKKKNMHIGVQRSKFIGTEREFFCISIARPLVLTPGDLCSITIGFRIDPAFKKVVKFWDDPSIPRAEIGETCERCPLSREACSDRVAEATIYQHEQRIDHQKQEVMQLIDASGRLR